MAKTIKTVQLSQDLIDALKVLAEAKGWSFQVALEETSKKGLKHIKL
jgi:hypothetical protein